MADYEGLIRVGIEGLGEIRELERRLQSAVDLFGDLERANANVAQAAQSSQRNVEAAGRGRAVAGRELRTATRTVGNVAQRRDPNTGLFLPGGPNATARRLAGANLRLAQRDVREADRNLRQETQNRRLISAAQQRYALALERAGDVIGGVQGGLAEAQARLETAMRGMDRESRINYLTNLFQGRQREFARGGGGVRLTPELQQQARNTRAGFDVASVPGRENLQLMQRLATEISGLVRVQGESNRLSAGRSIGFEAGRRGQELITELSRRPGADPARIRELRSRATDVVSAGFTGDIAGSREAKTRMRAAIGRYTRELNDAASQLQQQQRAGFRNLNVRQSWAKVLEDFGGELRQSVQQNIGVSQAGREASNFGFGLAGDAVAKSIRRNQEKRAIAEAKLAAVATAEAAAREALLARVQQNIGVSQAGREASGFGFGLAGDAVAKAIRRNQEKRAAAEARLAAIAEAEAQAREALLARVQQNIGVSQASREVSNFGFGSAGDATAKSIRRNREKIAAATAREAAAAARSANQIDAAGRAAEFRRTQGLTFDERLARRRPDLAPGGKPRQGFFQGNARKAVGEGLIGGAFPLLFGQGVGASAGGLAGGALGGAIGGSFGFGLSLAGTALGQAVDTTATNLKELASSLKSPNDAIAALEASGFRVGDSLKLQVEQLQAVGRGYDAQTLVLQEVEKRLGAGSVQGLNALNAEQKRLESTSAKLAGALQSELLPALTGFVSGINEIVNAARGLQEFLVGVGELPVIKQLREGTDTFASTPLGRLLVPGSMATGIFQAAQRRGREVMAEAPNRPQRSPRDVITDADRLLDVNEKNKDAQREYKNLAREVEDFRRDNEDKIFNMRRQAADIEKQKSDLRLEVENKIFDMRQETAKLEIDNARTRAQIATQSFDLGLAQQADALGGKGGDFIDQVREYLRVREEGEANLQANEATVKLQIASKERELQQYVLQVSDKVAAIARTVEDYKRDQAKFRFETSRRLEDYRIKAEDYIYSRVRERYDYAIGSEQEILRIKMEAAAQMGANLPPDANNMLGGAPGRANPVGVSGLANPFGPQKSGRPLNWNDGLGAGRGHKGRDVGLDDGTTIHAMEDAIVHSIIRGFGRAGDAVQLRYNKSQNLGVYGHINPTKGLAVGQRVTAGQQIGVVTPDGENTHFHGELYSPSGQLLDPSQRLKEAMKAPRYAAPAPVKPQPRPQPQPQPQAAPTAAQPTTIPGRLLEQLRRDLFNGIFNWGSSLPEAGASPVSQSGGGFDMSSLSKISPEYGDVASQQPLPKERMQRQAARPFLELWKTWESFTNDIFAPSKQEIRRTAKPDPARNKQVLERIEKTQNAIDNYKPLDAKWKEIDNKLREVKRSKPATMSAASLVSAVEGIYTNLGDTVRRAGGLAVKAGERLGSMLDFSEYASPQQSQIIGKGVREVLSSAYERSIMRGGNANAFNDAIDQLAPLTRKFGGLIEEVLQIEARKGNVYAEKALPKLRLAPMPAARPEERRDMMDRLDRIYEQPRIVPGVQNRIEGASLPSGGAFDMSSLSKLGTEYAPIASTAQAVPVLPFSQQVDQLPSYGPAPAAPPAQRPVSEGLPAVPGPMAPTNIGPIFRQGSEQREELEESIDLQRKLQKIENGRALLQLASTREVRNRVEDAAGELDLQTRLLGVDSSLSQNDQERSAERIRTLAATEDINAAETQALDIAGQLLGLKQLEQGEYDKITKGVRERAIYEKQLLGIAQQSAELARQRAFDEESGALARSTRLTGAGLRAGFIGPGARAFEAQMAIDGDMGKATQRAEENKLLQQQQLIWDNLERNIVDVSDAISGALTNGLVDVISGAKKFEDVGREVLDSISRSFADSAQQQLSSLIQGQIAGLAGGEGGLLTKLFGAAPAAVTSAAGPQALGAASLSASTQVLAFGASLQLINAQMTASSFLSSATGGGGGGGGFGSIFSSVIGGALGGLGGGGANFSSAFSAGASPIPGIGSAFSAGFGGFLANGGVTKPGEGYVVGEKEPEFFFPGVTGRVVPRSDMEKASALQQDDSSNEPIDLRYTVTEQRGERYVTEEQFRKGMASTSKRAQAMTYAGMRNNKNVRDYVGV